MQCCLQILEYQKVFQIYIIIYGSSESSMEAILLTSVYVNFQIRKEAQTPAFWCRKHFNFVKSVVSVGVSFRSKAFISDTVRIQSTKNSYWLMSVFVYCIFMKRFLKPLAEIFYATDGQQILHHLVEWMNFLQQGCWRPDGTWVYQLCLVRVWQFDVPDRGIQNFCNQAQRFFAN